MTDPLLATLLLAWITACAQAHGVDPAFARAVMCVESRSANGPELGIRVGPLGKSGKFVGPGGIAKCFAKDANIYNPFINALITVGALRGKDKRRVLSRYNTEMTEAYYQEVRRIERKLKEGL